MGNGSAIAHASGSVSEAADDEGDCGVAVRAQDGYRPLQQIANPVVEGDQERLGRKTPTVAIQPAQILGQVHRLVALRVHVAQLRSHLGGAHTLGIGSIADRRRGVAAVVQLVVHQHRNVADDWRRGSLCGEADPAPLSEANRGIATRAADICSSRRFKSILSLWLDG